MPMDGRVPLDVMQSVIDEMRQLGELTEPIEPEDLLVDRFMEAAFAELCARPSLQPIVTKVLGVLGGS